MKITKMITTQRIPSLKCKFFIDNLISNTYNILKENFMIKNIFDVIKDIFKSASDVDLPDITWEELKDYVM